MTPALPGSASSFTCRTDLQWRCVVGPLLAQAARDRDAIDAVHPGEVRRDRACLVRLNLANEVPVKTFALQGCDFWQRFLG